MTIARAQCKSLGINKAAKGNFENKYKNVNAGAKFIDVVFSTPGRFTWTKPPHVELVELLVVGGGGGGGSSTTTQAGGGGGAGAVVYQKMYLGGIPTWYVMVGKGGAGALGSTTNRYGRHGSPSSFGPSSLRWSHTRFENNLTLPFGGGGAENIGRGEDVYSGVGPESTLNVFAEAGSGGGGGGGFSSSMPGASHGGCGVGARERFLLQAVGAGPGFATFSGQGNIGGWSGGTTGATSGAGGGGGCNGPGQGGTTSVGGNGGAGISIMGRAVGGGGGGGRGAGSAGTGSFGGGNGSTTGNAANAVDGSGGGGGGAGGNGTARNGGKGGNGIVVIRYYV
jgi:hypothetical protein